MGNENSCGHPNQNRSFITKPEGNLGEKTNPSVKRRTGRNEGVSSPPLFSHWALNFRQLTRFGHLCIISHQYWIDHSPADERLRAGRAVILQDQAQFRSELPRREPESWIVWLVLLLAVSLASTGCGEKKKAQVKLPPPPQIAVTNGSKPAEPIPPAPPVPIPRSPKPEPWTQTGVASWYVADPKGQKTASGEPYDGMALTAAHRTLPFQSVVRVTNLKTKSQVIVRVNDRGPFVDGRIIDLSLTAAKALDMRLPGLATVKLEVLHTPAAIDIGGKWCVQIGAFRQRIGALDLKKTLAARFRQARLLDFPGATGYWVRLCVQDDDRVLAQRAASNIKVSEGGVFLVRLD
jgi:rare lipoprotein A